AERPPPDPRLLRRRALPGDLLPDERPRARRAHDQGRHAPGRDHGFRLGAERRSVRPRARRHRPRGEGRPQRVRCQLERAQPGRRQLPRRRRHHQGRPRAREAGRLTMRILAVSGSLRESSYNTSLLRAALEAAPEGVELELWEGLGELPFYDEDLEADGVPDSVRRLREDWGAADAILFATP